MAKERTLFEAALYWASTEPRSPAILAPGELTLEFEELWAASCGLVATLAADRRTPDTIVFSGPVCIELVVVFVAASQLRIPVTPWRPQWQEAGAGRLFLEGKLISLLCTDQPPSLNAEEVIEFKPNLTYRRWLDSTSAWREEHALPVGQSDGPLYFNFTSGSTGAPTAALATDRNVYWNAMSAIEALAIEPSDRMFCGFPSWLHPHELLARSVHGGATAVIADAGELGLTGLLEHLEQSRTTLLHASPSFYHQVTTVNRRLKVQLPELRCAESGGMPTASEVSDAFRASFGGSGLTPVWGSTEATGVALGVPLGEEPAADTDIGEVRPYYEADVVGPDEEAGELVLRGPAVADSPHETRKGVLRTGDMVRRTGKLLQYVAREDDLVKVAGLAVHLEAVAAAIRRAPGIADAAVLANPDPIRGTSLVAAIATDGSYSEADVRSFLSRDLAPHELPRALVRLASLPRTQSGKLLRGELRRLIRTQP